MTRCPVTSSMTVARSGPMARAVRVGTPPNSVRPESWTRVAAQPPRPGRFVQLDQLLLAVGLHGHLAPRARDPHRGGQVEGDGRRPGRRIEGLDDQVGQPRRGGVRALCDLLPACIPEVPADDDDLLHVLGPEHVGRRCLPFTLRVSRPRRLVGDRRVRCPLAVGVSRREQPSSFDSFGDGAIDGVGQASRKWTSRPRACRQGRPECPCGAG